MLIKKITQTPSSRFLKYFKNYDLTHLNIRSSKNNTNLLRKKHFKRYYKPFLNTNMHLYNLLVYVAPSYIANSTKTFFKTFTVEKDILYLPNINHVLPGTFCFVSLTKIIKSNKFLGSIFLTINTPFNIFISNLLINKRIIYAKSSGTYAKRLKSKKKEKLLKIELPSTKICFFPNNICNFIGQNINLFTHKVVEGKWGFSLANSKKINVRGVAKNPVDHPNGGRTKAKQPEKSPWGWIAKQSK